MRLFAFCGLPPPHGLMHRNDGVKRATARVLQRQITDDGDGFLFIEGRRARFSKIGGEMVPHGVVEEELAKWCKKTGRAAEGVLEVMVTAVEDERKGEALVVLHAVDLDPVEAEKALREAELPNLWIPRKFKRVEKIPLLASGKLDLAAAKKMAQS